MNNLNKKRKAYEEILKLVTLYDKASANELKVSISDLIVDIIKENIGSEA